MQTSLALRAAVAALAFLVALAAHGAVEARVLGDEASLTALATTDDGEALRSDLSVTLPVAPAPRRVAARELTIGAALEPVRAPDGHRLQPRVRWRRLPRMSLDASSGH
jgi:hypothetical protein